MTEDWAADVKKYAPDADPKVIKGIVRYCGIALQSSDASLVSFTDKEEVARVRENFLKKKLGLTNPRYGARQSDYGRWRQDERLP